MSSGGAGARLAGGGGAKAAAALRSGPPAATGGKGRGAAPPPRSSITSSTAASTAAARASRRPRAAALSSSSSSSEADDDSGSAGEESVEDGTSEDDSARHSARHQRRLSAAIAVDTESSDDDDPLEPSNVAGVPVAAVEAGAVPTPLFRATLESVVAAPRDSKGRAVPLLSEEEALSIVLESNGITRDEHAKQPHGPKGAYLEVFQISRFRRIQGLAPFGPAVRHLEIMQQNLTQIEGLQALVNLEILYLSTNRIARISGLESNVRLRELYLGENYITRLENLSHLRGLRVLSVYDNAISRIEGLENNTALTELHLARNKIQQVGHSLDHLTSLTTLNLSDNLLSSFSCIRHLSRLGSLTCLSLSDAHFGANPLVALCNYHTYALYHLGHVKTLDTLLMSEEARLMAEATWLKKQMYYHMRIKLCKGATSNLIKKGTEMARRRAGVIEALRRELARAYKACKDEEDEHAFENGRELPEATAERPLVPLEQLRSRKEQVASLLRVYNEQLASLSLFLARHFGRDLTKLSEQLIQRMLAELDSGGNERFEDGACCSGASAAGAGGGDAAWVRSCVHFMHTHLASTSMAKRFNLIGSAATSPSSGGGASTGAIPAPPLLRIRRVTKLHNRALRSRFEELLERKMESSLPDPSSVVNLGTKLPKPDLHYAFVGAAALGQLGAYTTAQGAPTSVEALVEGGNAALARAAEEGFDRVGKDGTPLTPQQRRDAERQLPALVLSNSVLHADLPRLAALHRAQPSLFSARASASGPHYLPGGVLIIAKVYLGNIVSRNAGAGGVLPGDAGVAPVGNNAAAASSGAASAAALLGPVVRPADHAGHVDSVVEEFAAEVLLGSGGSGGGGSSGGKAGSKRGATGDGDDDSSEKVGEGSSSAASGTSGVTGAAGGSGGETKLKRLYVFDPAFVLPEYLVSFDYVLAPLGGAPPLQSAEELAAALLYGASATAATAAAGGGSDIDPELLRVCGSFLGLREPLLDYSTLLGRMERVDDEARSVLQSFQSSSPKLAPRTDLQKALTSSSSSARLRSLQFLRFSELGLKAPLSFNFAGVASSLRVLVLSFNNLTRWDQCGLEVLTMLERLDLSYNAIRKLAPGVLSSLRALTNLDLSYNNLGSSSSGPAKDLLVLQGEGGGLRELDVRGNPSLQAKAGRTVRGVLVKALPALKRLDLLPVARESSSSSEEEGEEETDPDALAHPLYFVQPSFVAGSDAATSAESGEVTAASRDSKRKGGASSRAAGGKDDGSVSGGAITEALLLQQSFLDRDAALAQVRNSASAPTAVSPTNAGGPSMASSRARNVYTRVRLSDFLAETGQSVGGGGGKNGGSIPAPLFDLVLEVELDHQRLGSLQSPLLAKMPNLRKLSLHDNALPRIEGLDSMAKLEELCLERNGIQRIEGLSKLVALAKLDLGKNRISTLLLPDGTTSCLSSLPLAHTLTQLSLEENSLRSLAGLEGLTMLQELYLANNRLDNLKKDVIAHVKDLPRLLILDLSGNPCAMHHGQAVQERGGGSGSTTAVVTSSDPGSEYRLSVVYALRRLKVLDGVAIESAELSLAREAYAGRLTEEALAEHLGHGFFKHVDSLDLANAKLRHMDVLCAEKGFGNLRVLVLDGNLISDLSSLSPLALLRVLRLNRNRITAAPPPPSSSAPGAAVGGGVAGSEPARGFFAWFFPGLEVLELGYNRISSISALQLRGLSELRVLTLEGNEISRVEGLGSLSNLQQLVLAKNKIKRFEAGGRSFAGLNELRGLQLEENGLRSLAGLGPLPKLRALFLAYNRIAELGELENLAPERLSMLLSEVTLRNNPLARKHYYRAALIRRLATGPGGEPAPPSWSCVVDGKEVTSEERERAEAMFSAGGMRAGVVSGSLGPNGEPLVAAGGGMPNGAVYFYADAPRGGAGMQVMQPPTASSMLLVDKVPLQAKTFSLQGLGDAGGMAPPPGGLLAQQQYQQQQQQHYHHHAQMSLGGGGGGGGGGALSLGIGGVSIGHASHGHGHGATGVLHQMANLSLNLQHNINMSAAAASGGVHAHGHHGHGSMGAPHLHTRGSLIAASGGGGGGGGMMGLFAQQQSSPSPSPPAVGAMASPSPPNASLHFQLGAFGAAKQLLTPSSAAAAALARQQQMPRGSLSKSRK